MLQKQCNQTMFDLSKFQLSPSNLWSAKSLSSFQNRDEIQKFSEDFIWNFFIRRRYLSSELFDSTPGYYHEIVSADNWKNFYNFY